MAEIRQFKAEHYDKHWQRKLIQIIMEDRMFADQIGEVLNSDMFELAGYQEFVKIVYTYREKYGEFPSYEIMVSQINGQIDDHSDMLIKEMRGLLSSLRAEEKNPRDFESVKAESVEFCRLETVKEAMVESIDMLQSGNLEPILKRMGEAFLLGTSNDLGHDYQRDLEERYGEDTRNYIATGHEQLDRILDGGHGRDEIGIVIGPSGAGKSFLLANFAAHALERGRNVVYYTLELSKEKTAKRFDAYFTGIPINDLRDNLSRVREVVKEVKGELIVKFYPSKFASVQTIKNHLEKVTRTRWKPDLVIVDYIDLVKPSSRYTEKRHELEGIVEDLRGIASYFNTALWTATQANRAGAKSDLVVGEDVAEAFSKVFAADIVLTITRTTSMKEEGKAKYFIYKNRNGVDGIIFNGTLTPTTASVSFGERSNAEEEKQISRDRLTNLKKDLLREKSSAFMELS